MVVKCSKVIKKWWASGLYYHCFNVIYLIISLYQLSSVTQSCLTLSDPKDCSRPGFPVHHPTPGAYLNTSIESVMPSNHLILCHPLLLLPSIFPSIRVFFQWVSSSRQVAKGLELKFQHQSFQRIFRTDLLKDGLVGSPLSPRDSQESSPTPQFKSINSLVLSSLYGPTLTSVHNYWKNHSLD